MARPRRAGTPAHAAVIAEIEGRLRAAGWEVQQQPFEFSTGADAAAVLVALAAQILIIADFWTWGLAAWAAALPALLLIGLLAGSGRLYRAGAAASLLPADGSQPGGLRRCWLKLGQHAQTANIVAHLPGAASATGLAPVCLVAHSDSKSQPWPLAARMALLGLSSLAAAVFALLSVLRAAAPALTSAAAVAGLLALVAGVPVLFLFLAGAGNASPGAIDNASGAGLLLHLAECLAAEPPRFPVTILITGAEELGLLGAGAYLRATRADERRGLRVLNFDGIGMAGSLAWVGRRSGKGLSTLAREASGELGWPLRRLPAIGALFDHQRFDDAGLDAMTLVTVGRAARAIHTARDDASQLAVDGFRRAGTLALRVLKRLEADARLPAPPDQGSS